MFIHYFTHVPVSMGVAQSRIDAARASIEGWAGVAYREGEDLHARVGPGAFHNAKEIRLAIAEAEVRPAGVFYPVRWTASGAEALFPRLTANLILTHVGPDKTKLSLEGSYEPPLGSLGRVVDRMLLKSVAEATVQDWVDRVARALSSSVTLT